MKLLILGYAMHEKYESPEKCFADRVNHRAEWYALISAYNKLDRSALTKQILRKYDMYVGMRSRAELRASAHMFDLIVWVDASNRLPPEKSASCTVSADDADVVIRNNGSLADLQTSVADFCRQHLE